ncbi:MAG: sulfur carrier protein ThiS [Acidiferrobacter sp.]
MRIIINGQPHEYRDAPTVAALLATLGLVGRRVAVEINTEILPRSRHHDHRLQDGDRVEVVQAIGGG